MRLTQHAMEKCRLYGIEAETLLGALPIGERFLDLSRGGTLALVFAIEGRPWVAIVNPETESVITVYPTDQRTVESRRRSGRWMF